MTCRSAPYDLGKNTAMLASVLATGVVGCSYSPEFYELENIRPSHVVPKSSPAAFVGAFEALCSGGTVTEAKLVARLKDDGYVEVPSGAGGKRAFVVDDKRPMVLLSDMSRDDETPTHCAVSAASRTGQTHAATDFIQGAFADYQAIAPTAAGPGVEAAWRSPNGATLIYTRRDSAAALPATFTLGRIHVPGHVRPN